MISVDLTTLPRRLSASTAKATSVEYICCGVCKVLNGRSPTYPIAVIFVLVAPTVLQCLQKMTTVANRTFEVVGTLTWNDLPDDVSSTFCRHRKTHLFANIFSDYF